ncbi:MAG: hypothetical protein ACWA6Y_13905 [Polaromonas sp.]
MFVIAFGSYTNKWFAVRGSVVTDASGKDQGTCLRRCMTAIANWHRRLARYVYKNWLWRTGILRSMLLNM